MGTAMAYHGFPCPTGLDPFLMIHDAIAMMGRAGHDEHPLTALHRPDRTRRILIVGIHHIPLLFELAPLTSAQHHIIRPAHWKACC